MLTRESLRKVPLSHYVERIERDELFSLVRYGDGEWFAILQCSPRKYNSDKHRYYVGLGKELEALLRGPQRYEFGLGPVIFKAIPHNRVAKYLQKHDIQRDWICASIFARAMIRKEALPFFQVLQRKPLVFVGPERLKPAARLLRADRFVGIPLVNCYASLADITERTLRALDQVEKPAICSISAGIPAALLVDRIHQRLGDQVWALDVGSLYEPLVRLAIRSYHRAMLKQDSAYLRSLVEILRKEA